jgi:hypothetical protein
MSPSAPEELPVLTPRAIRQVALNNTVRALDEFGHAEQRAIIDATVAEIFQDYHIPRRLRLIMWELIRRTASEFQRSATGHFEVNDQRLSFRRWGKCRYQGRWLIVDMLEGPVRLVNRCLDVMADSIRRDRRHWHNTVAVVNARRGQTRRGRPYQPDPDV